MSEEKKKNEPPPPENPCDEKDIRGVFSQGADMGPGKKPKKEPQ